MAMHKRTNYHCQPSTEPDSDRVNPCFREAQNTALSQQLAFECAYSVPQAIDFIVDRLQRIVDNAIQWLPHTLQPEQNHFVVEPLLAVSSILEAETHRSMGAVP